MSRKSKPAKRVRVVRLGRKRYKFKLNRDDQLEVCELDTDFKPPLWRWVATL